MTNPKTSNKRIRAKHFPREQNERIENKYQISDLLEVQDTKTLHWIAATVIDRENNWIVIHFDGWPSKYNQKIHVVKHGDRVRVSQHAVEMKENENESGIGVWIRSIVCLPESYVELFESEGFDEMKLLYRL